MILAALLFIQKVATTTTSHRYPDYVKHSRAHVLQDKHIPDTPRSIAFTAVPVRRHGQDPGDPAAHPRIPAGVHPAAAQHDGDRCHRPAGSGRSRRQASTPPPRVDLVRATGTAARLMHKAGFRAPRGPRKHCANIDEALKRAGVVYKSLLKTGLASPAGLRSWSASNPHPQSDIIDGKSTPERMQPCPQARPHFRRRSDGAGLRFLRGAQPGPPEYPCSNAKPVPPELRIPANLPVKGEPFDFEKQVRAYFGTLG